MQNHFAETPEELKDQLRESFVCSMNPYYTLVQSMLGDTERADSLRKLLEATSTLMGCFAEEIARDARYYLLEEHKIARLAEEFHQNVAEEGQFAAVPYDPS